VTAAGAWVIGFMLGALVVLAVAALLIAILLVARSIERLAGQALGVAGEIVAATRPVWALGTANEVVEEIYGTVRSIEAHVIRIADDLAPEGGAGGAAP
jgi:hypothetical protein